MPVLDERAANHLDRRAKKLGRSASAVLSDLVREAAQQEARDHVLEGLAPAESIAGSDVRRWLKRLGAA